MNILLPFVILSATVAASEPVSCPLTLPADALTVRAPDGWVGYVPSFTRLTSWGMMAGPPETMTYLVPDNHRKTKGGGWSKWSFARGDEKWLHCTYGGSNVIQISRRLPDEAAECTLSYKAGEFGGVGQMTVACK